MYLMVERLQKILSQWGIASRRQAEAMISEGRVYVNGQVAHLGQQADPAVDQITVDGLAIAPGTRPDPHYFLLHKPFGVVSTCSDPWGRSTVLDLLGADLQGLGLHPVGRLDAESTGALLLTNDGLLTFHLTHPRHHIPKTYEVWVKGDPQPSVLQQWRQGVRLDGQRTLPAEVTVLATTADQTCLQIVLYEGRNRQIRRVAELLGHPVLALHRRAIGPVEMQQLPSGHYRPLTQDEIEQLKTLTNLTLQAPPVSSKQPSRKQASVR